MSVLTPLVVSAEPLLRAIKAGENDLVVGSLLLEALAWVAGALACAAIAGFIAGRL